MKRRTTRRVQRQASGGANKNGGNRKRVCVELCGCVGASRNAHGATGREGGEKGDEKYGGRAHQLATHCGAPDRSFCVEGTIHCVRASLNLNCAGGLSGVARG